MAVNAAELSVKISADTNQAVKGLESVSATLKRVSGDGQGMAQVFQGVLGANLVTGLVDQVKNLGSQALDSYTSFERISYSLQSLTARELKNAGAVNNMEDAMRMAAPKAKELQNWVQKLAILSPFTTEGVANAYRMMQAYGFNSKEAQRLTQAMADFTAGSGQSEDAMSKIALALGQIRARGNLAGQEVRQLTEAGIAVDQILAKAFGKTTEEIVTMRESGLMPAKDAIDALVSSFENDFGGAAQRQAGTFAGLRSSLEDIKEIGLREFFGETFRSVQPELQKFVDTMQDPKTIESIRKMGYEFGDITKKIVSQAKDVVTWYQNLDSGAKNAILALGGFVVLRPTIMRTFSDIAGGAASIVSVLVKMPGFFKDFADSFTLLKSGTSILEVMSLSAGGIAAVATSLGLVAAAIGSVAVAYQYFIGNTYTKGIADASAQWDDFFKRQAQSGKNATQVVGEFQKAYEGMVQNAESGGLDTKGLKLAALQELSKNLPKVTKNYAEYSKALRETAEAYGFMVDAQGDLYERSQVTMYGNTLNVKGTKLMSGYIDTDNQLMLSKTAELSQASLERLEQRAMRAKDQVGQLGTASATTSTDFEKLATASDNAKTRIDAWNNLNVNFGDKIAGELRKIEFYKLGGGDLQQAADEVQAALAAGKISPEEAKSMLNDLYVASQDVMVKMGQIDASAAAKNIKDNLGGSIEDSKKKLADIDNRLRSLPTEIHIKIIYDESEVVHHGVNLTDPSGREDADSLKDLYDWKKEGVGGTVFKDVPVVVGDRGVPEVFVPQTNGRIMQTYQVAGSGGGGGGVVFEAGAIQVNSISNLDIPWLAEEIFREARRKGFSS